jgi:Fe-S-cluster-containing dehydrogenase component
MKLSWALDGWWSWWRRESDAPTAPPVQPVARPVQVRADVVPATDKTGAPAARSATLARQLALVIDLDVCVGCQACVVSCKQWNSAGAAGLPPDPGAWEPSPHGTFFNRVQTWEAGSFPYTQTLHLPKSCLHCEDPPCVPVCPTGASIKRAEDGIVLVDADKCIGCKYCSWACPYGAREYDEGRGVMTKCTLCVDRIHDELLPPEDRQPACVKACPTGARLFGDVKDSASAVSRAVAERGGYALMPEWQTHPANRYLPRRAAGDAAAPPPPPTRSPE